MSGQEKTNEYFLLSICEKQICNRNAAEYRRRVFISNSYKGITGSNIAFGHGIATYRRINVQPFLPICAVEAIQVTFTYL